MRLGLVLLIMGMTASASEAAPAVVLHILKSGHVRLGNGPELSLDAFRDELQRRAAKMQLPEMALGLEEKPDYGKVAAVLTEMQKAGLTVGFMVGQSQ
jgi:biopolymer transport protein ExbD